MNTHPQYILIPNRLFGCLVLASLCLVTTPGIQAQEAASVFKSFQLQHADPKFVLNTLESLFEADKSQFSMDFDPKSKRISFIASPQILKKVEDIILQLDIAPNVQTHIEFIEIKDRPADEIAQVVREYLAAPADSQIDTTFRVAVDPNSNSIILSGEKDDVTNVRNFIEEIVKAGIKREASKPTVSCAVRISWLVDTTRISASGILDVPAESLTGLIDALQNQQVLRDAKVITSTQTVVQVKSDNNTSAGEFVTSSLRNFSSGNGQVSLNVQGTLTTTANGKFSLSLTMDAADRKDPIAIGTTLTLPKNHPVAFSVSDVGSFKSAFVVEILDAK